MTKICYTKKRFSARNLEIIKYINFIISREQVKKKRITVRKLHLELVKKNFFTDTRQDYKNVTRIISHARLAGLICWSAIDGRRQIYKGEK